MNEDILYLDLETYSEANLKSVGAYRYASDSSTEILLFAYAIGEDNPAKVWDLTDGSPMPEDLSEALDSDCKIVIHNSQFDRINLAYVKHEFLDTCRIHDTMLMAYCHGLPGSLDILGKIYGLPEDKAKMKEGRKLVLKFCKPLRGKRSTAETDPKQWAKFIQYAARDVEAMREIYHKLPRINYPDGPEYPLWLLDQEMNDRGFAVDLDLASAAVKMAEEEKEFMNERTYKKTNGAVQAATQRDKLLEHFLEEYGVALPDMQKATLERRVNDQTLPEEVRQLIAIRLQSSKTTASKYQKVIDCEIGGRLLGTTQFAGASRTLRDAGRLFQHQNLARPTMWNHLEDDPEALETAIEETVQQVKDGATPYVHDDPMDVLGNTIRSVIVAPKGKELHVADLSNIEGRTLIWLSGEKWKLDFFRNFDAGNIQYDNYIAAYAEAMNVDPATVDGSQRAIGKVMELALGYGGGVSAFINFANVYNLDLEELAESVWSTSPRMEMEDCRQKHAWAKENGFDAGLNETVYAASEYLKRKWRDAHPATVKMWNDLKDTFALATKYQKKVFRVGRHIKIRRVGDYLMIRLPSGKSLVYLQPFEDASGLGYMGMDGYTRKFQKIYTHGGKLAENVASAVARDVLFRNLQLIKDKGFDTVFRVHDEVVAEAPEGHPDILPRLISNHHDWCADLPLAADGFITKRYRK